MSKRTGLGSQLWVSGYDLSGDAGSVPRISGGPAWLPVTGINKSAHERKGGRRDGRLMANVWFNDAAGQAHAALSPLPTADVMLTWAAGETVGDPAACLVAKQVGYDPTFGNDGSLSFGVEAQANAYGIEWGETLSAGTDNVTGAGNSASLDGAAASSNGLQAYLHVFAFTGTDVTIKLTESSDDFSADSASDVTGGAFTQVTSAPTWERIATANDLAVERYLRANFATSAGFSSLDYAIIVVRNSSAVEF